MKTISRWLVLAAVSCALASSVVAEPDSKTPMSRYQQVFSEVGLIVRSKPSSSGKRIGSLSKGERVKLDGEVLPANVEAVYPIVKKDDEGSCWVKIKTPVEGYVLYSAAGDDSYTYIVPCGE